MVHMRGANRSCIGGACNTWSSVWLKASGNCISCLTSLFFSGHEETQSICVTRKFLPAHGKGP